MPSPPARVSPAKWCATTSLTTQFIDGVGQGELIATGRLLRRGSKVAFAAGEVRDATGRLMATASGTWHLWSSRPAPQETGLEPWVELADGGERLRVHKIVAVGRNYADHVREMGADPKNEPPLFFTKPADAVVDSGASIPYPPDTSNLHHEVELVV
jgi:2-keto-4-pentenoate hydratase/2-oxohepta-3-ene-1,7-dioic acid hydratase in catechol pathway